VTCEVALLFEPSTTVFTGNREVVRHMVADVRQEVLSDLVAVGAIAPVTAWVDDRTTDVLVSDMELFICQYLSCISCEVSWGLTQSRIGPLKPL
jgi:hypothetical protein